MKRIYQIMATALLGLYPIVAEGQVTYSLPLTTIVMEVEACQDEFYAGPYARYAEKYLGIKPRQKDQTTYQITEVKIRPFVQADQSAMYTLDAVKSIDESVLKLSSLGLISFVDAQAVPESVWRFPVNTSADFSTKGISSNLTSESATLYRRNDKKDDAFGRVSIQQDMVVEKSIEKKAQEAADMILSLRKQRLQIVSGDTDATYSGEAMEAAVREITRLEEEYMTLFVGYSVSQVQKMNFEVIPQTDRTNQIYVAFRVSDAAGLVSADDLKGRPVVMEIVPDAAVQNPSVKPVKGQVQCRVPAVCTVRLKDGNELLLESRMPVYQLGYQMSIPLK